MALIKIAEAELTTFSQTSVTLTGMTSDYPVYYLIANYMEIDSSTYQHIDLRFTINGTEDSTNEYYQAQHNQDSNGTVYAGGSGPTTEHSLTNQLDADNNGFASYECFIFNPAKSDEFTYMTYEGIDKRRDSTIAFGRKGGMYHRTDVAHNGIKIFSESGANIKGLFTLFALKV